MSMKERKKCEPHFGGNPSDFGIDMPFASLYHVLNLLLEVHQFLKHLFRIPSD